MLQQLCTVPEAKYRTVTTGFTWQTSVFVYTCHMFALSLLSHSHDWCIWPLNVPYDSYCPHTSGSSVRYKWRNATSSHVIHEQTSVIALTCLPFTHSRWKAFKWPILIQVHCSHDMADIHKWQIFVKYNSRGNAVTKSQKKKNPSILCRQNACSTLKENVHMPIWQVTVSALTHRHKYNLCRIKQRLVPPLPAPKR